MNGGVLKIRVPFGSPNDKDYYLLESIWGPPTTYDNNIGRACQVLADRQVVALCSGFDTVGWVWGSKDLDLGAFPTAFLTPLLERP